MPVIVVQSDGLAAWVGLAGVVVGVVLTASVDSWRDQRTERRRLRADLLRAGGHVEASVRDLISTTRAVETALQRDPTQSLASWEMIQARKDAVRRAVEGVAQSGSPAVIEAARQLATCATVEIAHGDSEALDRRERAINSARTVYNAAVTAAKL